MGKKVLMAVTGVMLFGFVLGHMLGNLKLYQGQEKLNKYAEWLREIGDPALPYGSVLWIARIVLLVAVAIHIDAAVKLTLRNRRARPTSYSARNYAAADYAARTMRYSGVIIVAFIVYHILHLTFGVTHPEFDGHNVYGNVVAGFQIWWVAAAYMVANLLLGLHLYHGLWSMFQTLGLNSPQGDSLRRAFAVGFAALVTLGNLSFPIAVLTGIVS